MLAHFTLKLLLIALPLMAAHSLLELAPFPPHALLLLKLNALMPITALTLLPHALKIPQLLRFAATQVLVLILFHLTALKQLPQTVSSIQLLLAHALLVLLPQLVAPLPALLLPLLTLAPAFALD